MKGILVSLLFVASFLILGLFITPKVFAGGDVLAPACEMASDAEACQGRGDANPQGKIFGPQGVLTKVANFIIMIVGVASVIMIMIGGFKYITSSGDPTNTKSAKDTILFAVVGIVVAIFGEAIVLFVLNRL